MVQVMDWFRMGVVCTYEVPLKFEVGIGRFLSLVKGDLTFAVQRTVSAFAPFISGLLSHHFDLKYKSHTVVNQTFYIMASCCHRHDGKGIGEKSVCPTCGLAFRLRWCEMLRLLRDAGSPLWMKWYSRLERNSYWKGVRKKLLVKVRNISPSLLLIPQIDFKSTMNTKVADSFVALVPYGRKFFQICPWSTRLTRVHSLRLNKRIVPGTIHGTKKKNDREFNQCVLSLSPMPCSFIFN